MFIGEEHLRKGGTCLQARGFISIKFQNVVIFHFLVTVNNYDYDIQPTTYFNTTIFTLIYLVLFISNLFFF